MKKSVKWIGWYGACGLISSFLFFILYVFENPLSEWIANGTGLVCGFFCRESLLCIVLLSLIIFVFSIFVFFCINSAKNMGDSDDVVFAKIDKQKTYFSFNRHSYSRYIELLNHLYSEHGPVKEISDLHEIDRLLKRREQLEDQLDFSSACYTALSSIGLSVIGAGIMAYINERNPVLVLLVVLIMSAFIFTIIFLKYHHSSMGLNRYLTSVFRYELELLNDVITDYNKSCKVDIWDEKAYEMQMATIAELSKKMRNAKRKDKPKIEADLLCLEKLNLSNYDRGSCVYVDICISKVEGHLVYSKKGNAAAGSSKKGQLINKEYKTFQRIVQTYKLSESKEAQK